MKKQKELNQSRCISDLIRMFEHIRMVYCIIIQLRVFQRRKYLEFEPTIDIDYINLLSPSAC